jgi:hypothetical protein
MASGQPLHPEVAAFVDAALSAGDRELAPDALGRWQERLCRLGPSDRDLAAAQLVAIAIALVEESGSDGASLVVQLAEIVAALVGDPAEATDRFSSAGVDLKKIAQTMGGATPTAVPSAKTSPAEGSQTLLQFLLSGGTTRRK